jgi:hypothetical protein
MNENHSYIGTKGNNGTPPQARSCQSIRRAAMEHSERLSWMAVRSLRKARLPRTLIPRTSLSQQMMLMHPSIHRFAKISIHNHRPESQTGH